MTAAVRSRHNGYLWAALAGTICTVDGPTRMAITGSARLAEFNAARTCFERIQAALPDTESSAELDYVRSSLTPSLAEVLVEVGALELADSLAARELQREMSGGGGERGNIVYQMNQVRGRIALRRGRSSEAIEFLHRSSETPGSPQLITF